jgi:hypothetical protein
MEVVVMRLSPAWFLPHDEDVMLRLREQLDTVSESMDILGSWVHGTVAVDVAIRELRPLVHTERQQRRGLHAAVRASFSTPLDPEDIFELGERLGVLLTSAYLLVREAEVSHTAPDQGLSAIVDVVLAASPPLGAAIRQLPHDAAAALADEAADILAGAEHAYRKAISGLEHEQHARREIRRRELYRRGEHMTAAMLRIAHRTWYAVCKTS